MIVYENKIASSFQAVDDAVNAILAQFREQGKLTDPHVLFKVSFMLREIMNNAVEHGNCFSPDKSVYVKAQYFPSHLMFEVSDEGEGIPFNFLNPRLGDGNLLRERQRGIETIQDMAFALEIIHNRVLIRFELTQEAQHG